MQVTDTNLRVRAYNTVEIEFDPGEVVGTFQQRYGYGESAKLRDITVTLTSAKVSSAIENVGRGPRSWAHSVKFFGAYIKKDGSNGRSIPYFDRVISEALGLAALTEKLIAEHGASTKLTLEVN